MTMIHDEDPNNQLNVALDALSTLRYALESPGYSSDDSLAMTAQVILWSIQDAIARIEQRYEKQLETLSEVGIHAMMARKGIDYPAVVAKVADDQQTQEKVTAVS